MSPINQELAQVVVLSFMLIVMTIAIVFGIMGSIAFWKTQKGAAKSFGLLFRRGNFLRIATVVFVVLAVVLLSAINALTSGAVAVLSGIAGYVLGGLERGNNQPDENNSDLE